MSVYARLAGKLDFPNSHRLIGIMEQSMTQEQAMIVDALPGSPAEIAEKFGLNLEAAKATLEYLFYRGMVLARGDLSNRNSYRFHRTIIQFHDATLVCLSPDKHKELFHMWYEFFHNDFFPDLAKEELAFGRVVPAYSSIKDLPDVQPWENFREIIKAQDRIAVVTCLCRLENRMAGKNCQHTDVDDESLWKCFQFNKGADYAMIRGIGKQLTHEEAIALADKIEEDGLIHTWAADRKMIGQISCQCCEDCCILFLATRENAPDKIPYLKSRYVAIVNQDECSGCQECVERCNFNAIEMVQQGKKYKAAIDEEKCWGCGVCTVKCSTGAMKMVAVRPVDFIPEMAQNG